MPGVNIVGFLMIRGYTRLYYEEIRYWGERNCGEMGEMMLWGRYCFMLAYHLLYMAIVLHVATIQEFIGMLFCNFKAYLRIA